MAEGEISAQTNLEEFLQNPKADKDDDHRKPVASEDSLEFFASSLTVDDAFNLYRKLSVESAGIHFSGIQSMDVCFSFALLQIRLSLMMTPARSLPRPKTRCL